MKKSVLIILLIFNTDFLYAQIGGKRIFEFLNLPANARIAGLGGVVVSSTDNDVNMFLSNPVLLDSANDNFLSLNHLDFYANIKYNSVVYAKNLGKLGTFGFGVQHIRYGSFDSYDASGNSIGTFKAGETAVTISRNHTLDLFTIGVNLKYVQSLIDVYKAFGFFIDFGGAFKHPKQEFIITINFKNIGFLVSDYTNTSDSRLPFDVQIGTTFKPEFMPFRFTFTGYNLVRDNIVFFDESISSPNNKPKQADKILRHINIGAELIIRKIFNIRIGYNHLLRKELRLKNTAKGAGISFGFMIRIKTFELAYTNTTYHADGRKNFITITSNLGKIIKKKRKV